MAKKEYKEATTGTLVKFEKEGEEIEGTYMGYEESHQFPGSYAVSIKQGEENKIVFVSGIVVDLIKKNNILPGTSIKIAYMGKRKTLDKKREYNDYRLYYC